jgi:hypothetical protein
MAALPASSVRLAPYARPTRPTARRGAVVTGSLLDGDQVCRRVRTHRLEGTRHLEVLEGCIGRAVLQDVALTRRCVDVEV